MTGFDSKYSGAQVEALLDQVASGNAGGGGGGGITVETDPIFSASPAAGITEKQISDWDGMAEALNLLDGDVAALTDEVAGKQDEIADLATIRSGAAKGATALQSYTEQYKGTVTGVKVNGSTKTPSSGTVDIGNVTTSIKMNGATKTPSGGVVDLGTVITSHQDISGKQDKLVSGTNIKTINGASILGSGNITIEGGSGGGSTTTKPYVLQAVALSELEALGVGEHTLYFRDYQKAGEDLAALQDAAIGDGLVALEYPSDESIQPGYLFPTSVRLGSEEYGAEVQFYLNGATFTLYYPTAPSSEYSDIIVSVLRQGEKEVVSVDNGGGATNDIYDMRPNVIYVPVLCNQVNIHNFLPAQVSEDRMFAYDVFTAILDLENTPIDGDPPYLAIVDDIEWVNGEFPELTEGLWELNIARYTEWTGTENYIRYLGVLTPFKYQ